MRINFLRATNGIALTKTFTKTKTGYDVDQYPQVKYFDSFEHDVANIDELHDHILAHAQEGHALVKGNLNKVLINERRAGQTNPNQPSALIHFDIDTSTGFTSVDDILTQLGPEFENVSYIRQDSASAGITSPQGLRTHIYMISKHEFTPAAWKVWIKQKNFEVAGFAQQIQLNPDKVTLAYAFDTCSFNSDKPLYISAPTCKGFRDPIKDRITLVTKKQKTVDIKLEANPSMVEELQSTLVNELRAKEGLKKRTPRTKTFGTMEVISNPNRAVVTGEKIERGFVYLNLNGGDSWAYYYPEGKPDILFSFKSDEAVSLKALAPDYYNQVAGQSTVNKPFTPIVLRDFKTDAYYCLKHYTADDTVVLSRASSTQKLDHFMQQHGEPSPDIIEDWDMEFNPTITTVIDKQKHWFNKFSPSVYRKQQPKTKKYKIPRVINKILTSICVDEPTKDYFVNWLAYVFTTGKKAGTAWLFHGTEGTGKGLLFSRILRPMLGYDYSQMVTTQTFLDQFNGYVGSTCLLWLDEFDVGYKDAEKIMAKLRNLVTEDNITVREMHTNPYKAPNYTNLIIASNHQTPLMLSDKDRRYNIAPRQEHPLLITVDEIDSIKNELEEFANYLHSYAIRTEDVHRTLRNEHRQKMIEAAMTDTKKFFNAVINGDLDYFVGYLRSDNRYTPDGYNDYQTVIKKWIEAVSITEPVHIPRDDLRTVYAYITGKRETPSTFSRKCAQEHLPILPLRIDGKVVRGFKVKNFELSIDPDIITSEENQNVIPFKHGDTD